MIFPYSIFKLHTVDIAGFILLFQLLLGRFQLFGEGKSLPPVLLQIVTPVATQRTTLGHSKPPYNIFAQIRPCNN